MTSWEAFNRLCAWKMGDYYSVQIYDHIPTKHHAAVVLIQDGLPTVCVIGPTCQSRLAALSFGMMMVKSRLEGEKSD